MKDKGIKQIAVLFIVLVVPVFGYLLLKTGTNHYKALPIYGNKYVEKKIIDGKEVEDTIYHTIGAFKLVNQFADTITDETVAGKIKIVDFFFADCQTICPKMSTQMERIQEKIKTSDDMLILSHTVNPEADSIPVLARYASNFHAIKNKWHFLTADKKQLYDLARHDYLVSAMQGDNGPDDFIHTELFVLVDKENRIRGFYDGTSEKAVDSLIDELKVLIKEEISPKKRK